MKNASVFGDVLHDLDDEDFGESIHKEDTPDSVIQPEPSTVPPRPIALTASSSYSRPRTPGGPRSPATLIMSNPDKKLPNTYADSPTNKKPTLVLCSDEEEFDLPDDRTSPIARKTDSESSSFGAISSAPPSGRSPLTGCKSPLNPNFTSAAGRVSKTLTITKPTPDALVGLVTTSVEPKEDGVVKGVKVVDVKEGGLAASAGLQAGDVIQKLNGLAVTRHEQFAELIKTADGSVQIDVLKPPPPVEPTSKPSPPEYAKQPQPPTVVKPPRTVKIMKPTEDTVVGITAVNLDGNEKGVEVSKVVEGGLSAKAGIVAGEIIRKINGLAVSRHEMFSELIRGTAGEITLEVHQRPVAQDPILAATQPCSGTESSAAKPAEQSKDKTAAALPSMPLPRAIPYPHPATAPNVPAR